MTLFRCACEGRMIVLEGRDAGMDQQLIEALACAAGLERALAEYPEDVAAAAAQALNNTGGFHVPEDPAAEPWPPMRAGAGL